MNWAFIENSHLFCANVDNFRLVLSPVGARVIDLLLKSAAPVARAPLPDLEIARKMRPRHFNDAVKKVVSNLLFNYFSGSFDRRFNLALGNNRLAN